MMKQGWITILLLIIGLGGARVLTGQQLHSEYYSINDGLSDRMVTDILLSRFGFVWIATPNGLNRFDGYDFLQLREYDSENLEQTRLSRSHIDRLAEDADGNIVIIYTNFFGFIDILNPNTFEIRRVDLLPQRGIEGHPRDIVVDKKGRVFVISILQEGGTYVYQLRGEGFERVWQLDDRWPSVASVLHLRPLRDGRFLLYDTEHGMRLFDESGRLLRRLDIDPYDPEARYGGGRFENLNFLYEDQLGRLWFSFFGHEGLFIWRGDEREPGRYVVLPQDRYYTHIWEDQAGNLLICQAQSPANLQRPRQLYVTTPEDEVSDFSHLLQDATYVGVVAGHNFFRTLFFGINNGLKIVQNTQTRLMTFLAEDLPEDQRGNVIRGMTGDGAGMVYFIQEGGNWCSLDKTTNVLDTLRLHDEKTGALVRFSGGEDLQYDPRGYLWGIVTDPNGIEGWLLRYELATCNVRIYEYPAPLTCMTSDAQGLLWLGVETLNSGGSLVYFDPGREQFTRVSNKQGENFLHQAPPRYLTWDRNGKLWIGAQTAGLFRYDPKDQVVTRYTKETRPELFGDYTVTVIHEDSVGRLWLGTQNGLHIFDPKTEEVQRYTTQEGLSHNIIVGLLPDEKGGYWISTYNGLTFFDPVNKTFRRYYRTDGLSNDEFNRFSFHRDEGGRYYFGGVNGLNAFYPQDLLVSRSTPKVLLTQIVRYGRDRETDVANLHDLRRLEIGPDETSFAVQFALPVFTRPSRNRYRAYLEGLDEEWVELNNEHTLRYNNLRSGRYTLYLQGADPNGNFSQDMLVLPIRVREYFFKQRWFSILVILLIIGLIAWILQNRLQNRLQEERLRTRLSSDLHDEVSGLLAGITMQAELLQTMTADSNLHTRLQGIGEAGRKAMSKMGDVIWSIDSRRDKVGDLLTRMQEHADDVLLPLEIRYSFQTERLEPQQKLPVHIRQDLYFIFKEAINNIAKHSCASRVNISLHNNGSDFEMVIEDNGDGHKNGTPLRKGQGLANLYMRAQRLGARLEIDPQDGYKIRLRMRKFA